MVVEALLLFGSHARSDDSSQSDWDVIAVVDDGKRIPYENGALSISFYSRPFLLKLAETGNLFALHLVSEAKEIYDPISILDQMKISFKKKSSYKKDIADASMLGYFLLRHEDRVSNWKLFNKRVAWCVRTILIAFAYENGNILFSTSALFRHFQNIDADSLIKNKNSEIHDEKSKYRLARFLRDFGLGDPKIYEIDNILFHIEYIFRSDNIVGKNTIASLFGAAHDDYVMERRRAI